MGVTEEVLEKYKRGKYQACLEILNATETTDDLVENFVVENCKLICESLVKLKENDADKIYEMQEQHYLYFEKVTSIANITNKIPIQLKLNASFNLIFWLLFYNDVELDQTEIEDYLELVNKGLLSVLGKDNTLYTSSNASEDILNHLKCLKNLILDQDYKTVLLILEFVAVIIVYVIKLKRTLARECLEVVSLFVGDSKQSIQSIASVEEFLKVKKETLCLFRFSLLRTGALFSELDSGVIDCLFILQSVLQFLLEDFRGSLKSLQKNTQTTVKSLWNYLVILNSFELENWSLCNGFLSKMSAMTVEKNFKARICIMQGKLCSIKRNYKEALKHYKSASTLSPNCPVVYYFMGQECGKMGLIDLMVENFEKLLLMLQCEEVEDEFMPNFQTALLDWIHPDGEITEPEVYYALAVAYGLSENFKKSVDMFDKVLQSLERHTSCIKRKIVEIPCYVTVLHEASVMNLMLGNLVRAEQIALEAIDEYIIQKPPGKRSSRLCRDIEWLQKLIQHELLETNLEPKELDNETFYSEDLIFFFPQNVIALLILSEIQRIQEIDDHKTTLSNVYSMFSKYLASNHNKGETDERVLMLVKALAGKTCVKIAEIQMKASDDFSSIEKMLKRALSCNRGDKDALYNYYKLLRKAGKTKEALKLWNTFSNENTATVIDSLQSFSLRYLLTEKITKRELENVKREIASTLS